MSSSRGPGERLQASRIEMGLSIDDVAARMHLNNDIVESIEENNFNDITAPIFVKGYLRAYARIVSLDEDEMIQQYAEFYSNEDPPIGSTSNLAPEISSSDKRVRVITFLVIVGLVGLVATWWWNKYQTQTDLVSLDAQQSSEIQMAEIVEESAGIEIEAVSETRNQAQTPIESAESTTDLLASSVDSDQESVDTIASMQAEPEPEAGAEAVPTAAEAELETEPDEVAMAIPDALAGSNPEQPLSENEAGQSQQSNALAPVVLSDAISRQSPAGSDQLKIVVNADSWVEINDANGHRLLYTLIRARQKFNLTGKAPFTVFFGNGYGVEVTFNGEEVDIISRVKGDNTVRLKIGS